mgnify:CR=1 FL=1
MKSLFFFLTLWTFLPLFAGYAPDNVQTALTKMYPSVKGIAWSQDAVSYTHLRAHEMATCCSQTCGQAERADKISDIVYSER